MLTKNLLLALATAMPMVAVTGCGDAPAPIIPTEGVKSGAEAVVPTADPNVYPVGPYGWTLDGIIPNLAFMGKMDANGNGLVNDDDPVRISFADFYQKRKDIKVLAFLIAAEWCGPCNQEQGELVDSYNKFQADKKGVAYLEALTESNDSKRSPADLATIDRWTGKSWTDQQNGKTGLKIPFPVVTDPGKDALMLGASAIPTQLLIRTSDMRIMWFNQGYGKGVLEANINDVLDNGLE